LRVAARRGWTYWGRFSVGAGTILVGCWMWMTFSLGINMPAAVMGSQLFTALASVALVHCLCAGAYTVDAISREKREGTLGLLFLTDLRGVDVVAGKLVATGVHAVLGLAAAVPVMSVCLLLGGVSGEVLWKTSLALLNTLLLSLTGGLMVSALSRDARKASSGFILLLLLLTFGFPVLGHVVRPWLGRVGGPELLPFFLLASPVLAFGSALGGTGFLGFGNINPYWWCMLTLHGLIWVFLGITALVLPRVWQERSPGAWLEPLRRAWHWVVFGDSESRRRRRRRLLDLNPICWLSSRERWRVPAVCGVMLLAAAGWSYGWHKIGRDWLSPSVGVVCGLLLHATFKCWYAAEACRRFAEDRENNAFELVLSTSMSVRGILWGRWLALLRSFGMAWVLMVVADLGLLIAGLRSWSGAAGREYMVMVWGAGLWFLLVHFVALGSVGMWRSLTARSVNQAISMTVIQVLVWPWLVFGLVWGGILALRGVFLLSNSMAPWVESWEHLGFWLWFVLMMSLNLGAVFWATRRLLRDFRSVATERFDRHRRNLGSA